MSETPTAARPRAPSLGRTRAAFDRDEQRRQKREAVLRVAASAFNRRGFANTSMDDVASVLGVSKPTLYQYFKSKQELLYACHQVAMDNGEAGLALATAHPGTGLEKLLIYLHRYMQGIFGDLGNCPVLTDVDSLTPADRESVVARRKRISLATKDLIALGVADGSIAPCDPKLASLFALGVVNWIPAWYREDGPNTPEEIMESFVALLTSGLAAPAAPQRRPAKAAPKAAPKAGRAAVSEAPARIPSPAPAKARPKAASKPGSAARKVAPKA